jgi:hypothetical protein
MLAVTAQSVLEQGRDRQVRNPLNYKNLKLKKKEKKKKEKENDA